jgi:hypothetical protein
MPWSAVLWASAFLVLSGSRALASIYHYEVTGTFPSNTTTTAYWAPDQPFEYRFSLEPETFTILTDDGRETAVVHAELVCVQEFLVAVNDDSSCQPLIPYQHISGIQIALPTA